MANADFSRQKPQQPQGFDEGSYKAAAKAAPARTLTPAQRRLAAFEQKLPAALKSQAAAAALCAVMILASVFGIGGAKLSGKYHAAANAFTTGVAADNGYTMAGELSARANNAANILTSAGQYAVDEAYMAAARAALDAFTAALDAGDVSDIYDANAALEAAVDQLYAAMQAAAPDPLKMGAVQTQYSDFNSAGVVLSNMAYNEQAQQYNEMARGFPASVIGALWNVKEVELFA